MNRKLVGGVVALVVVLLGVWLLFFRGGGDKPAGGGDYTNTLPSNFGCATQTNLGLMVANPRDLVMGRVPGPGSIDRQVKIEQDFRERKGQVLPCDMVGCPAGPPSKGEAP